MKLKTPIFTPIEYRVDEDDSGDFRYLIQWCGLSGQWWILNAKSEAVSFLDTLAVAKTRVLELCKKKWRK